MRYLDLNELCLVEQPVSSKESSQNDAHVNHILIYDRSYSMSQELKQLGNDLVDNIKKLPTNDTITLGWFSGESKFNFILKGFKITEEKDFDLLEKTIKANLRPIGTTCFSEILTDTDQVINDLSNLSTIFSLTFFTDGYPVVSNYNKEISNIQNAISNIEGRIASSLFVGYGNYYNKPLMTEMANRLGGSLAHCSSLVEYKVGLHEFMSQASESNGKIKVQLKTDTKEKDLVFDIKNQVVSDYKVQEDNTISFSPKKSGESFVYILTSQPPSKATKVTVTKSLTQGNDTLLKAAYGAAFLLTQKAKSDVALEILATLGDKALIDHVNNAFTIDDYGKAESKIKRAVFRNDARFKKGRDTEYLPPKDAFCVVDAIEILLKDEESFFYPTHPEFNYRRIGPATTKKEGYPTFIPDEKVACPFNSLTWNQTKLNLSILAKITGKVQFANKDYEKYGFQKEIPSYVYRNYALIKDGFLNVGRIPVMLSKPTAKIFKEHGLIDEDSGMKFLCLDKLPIINRSIAEGKTSAKALCRLVYKEVVLQAELKALKYIRNELEPVDASLHNDLLTDEQIKYLSDNGITKNGFSAPVDKKDPVDFYYAKEFFIKVKGLSSLPSVKSVRDKLTDGKKLTASAQLVHSGLKVFAQNAGKPKRIQLMVIDEYIEQRKENLFKLRKDIQRTKFSILLTSKWFDEFDSRENCTLEVDGNHFTLGVKEVKVNI